MAHTGNVPNTIRCIFRLRELGSPPTTFNFTNPSSKVETAVDMFGFLASHVSNDRSTSHRIRTHWDTGISTWVVFVLHHIILNRQQPLHFDSSFERSVGSLCEILRFSDEDTTWIENATPGLLHSIVQGWYRLMDIEHALVHEWSVTLHTFLQLRSASLPILPSSTSPILYPENAGLGQILLRNLKRHIRTLRSKTVRHLTDLHRFLMLLSKVSILPLLDKSNVLSTITVVCRLTDILLLAKKKRLQNGTVNSRIYRDAHGLVLMAFNIMLSCMHQPFRMDKLLKHKFLTSILYADSRYFCLDRLTSPPETKIGHLSAQVIKEVSTFLVYPVLLRSFIRSRRNLRLTKETFVDVGAGELWEAWTDADQKASTFYTVLQHVRKTATLCSYAKCPLIRASPEECQKTRYRRCLGCNSVVYCSRGCRANDWAAEHRGKCTEIANNKKDGFSPIMRDDVRFFAYVLEDHLRRFANEISQHFSSSFDSFMGYKYNDLAFSAENRKPILFIDFDTPKLPLATDARSLDQGTIDEWTKTGYFCGSAWLSSVFEQWQRIEPTEIFVMASFPRSQGVAWPYVTVVDFPLKDDLRFVFDILDDAVFP
ncbi:hypothetical protein V5O48_003012 [Marasmius crinis-equi]|uniref:MYND-type domain-containing protein n=1 Tax=Marasmius crinis-equi TaxID=585013 RepID=A0ABR3FTZ9_9AGAR